MRRRRGTTPNGSAGAGSVIAAAIGSSGLREGIKDWLLGSEIRTAGTTESRRVQAHQFRQRAGGRTGVEDRGIFG
jgi:hypothetical protein